MKGTPRCTLMIHPDDAARARARRGGDARGRDRQGAIELPVEVTETMMPGVVSVPHGWGHDRRGVRLRVAASVPGASVNDVIDSSTHRRAIRHERADRSARGGHAGMTDDDPSRPELFAKIGEAKLRAVITDFYSRVFGDVMIGFMFEGKDRQHLIDREYEFTARFLGGDVKYTGRPMRTAHAQPRSSAATSSGGCRSCARRSATMPSIPTSSRCGSITPLALRDQITGDKGSECKDTSVVAPEGAPPAPDPETRDQARPPQGLRHWYHRGP